MALAQNRLPNRVGVRTVLAALNREPPSYSTTCDEAVRMRCNAERRIVWGLLLHLDAKGWRPAGVFDDEETPTPTLAAAMEAVFAVDDCTLIMNDGTRSHHVRIVLGNDGTDCICDWSYDRRDADGFNALMESFDPLKFV